MTINTLEDAVAQYRAYWNCIKNIEPCSFRGEVDDINSLDYAIYEGFGAAPDSNDYFLESAVFANFLIRSADFELDELSRESGRIVLVRSKSFLPFRLNILSRVQDAMGRSNPQSDKMCALFEDLIREMICGCLDGDDLRILATKTKATHGVLESCQKVLTYLGTQTKGEQ